MAKLQHLRGSAASFPFLSLFSVRRKWQCLAEEEIKNNYAGLHLGMFPADVCIPLILASWSYVHFPTTRSHLEYSFFSTIRKVYYEHNKNTTHTLPRPRFL